MANKTITISREEYRHKVMSQITELGATGGGKFKDDPMFKFAMSLNNMSIARDIEKLLFGDEENKEG